MNAPTRLPSDVELCRLSGTALARLIRERVVTARTVVEAHIARIEHVNPRLNAVVHTRFADARREADEADDRQAAGQPLPPFHGVPCTIKESFAVAGCPNTAGHLARRGHCALVDAPTVARLKAAGGIVLGLTNTSELCLWMETDNRVYGRTKNPYNERRIVGGSSGGEGAIIGAGGSPFGLAADIGGSIRMPAFFNGVFGHKPTGGLVPTTGQHPVAEGEARLMLGTGPIARRAEDLMPLLRVLAGPDGEDNSCEAHALGDPATVSMVGRPVLMFEDPGQRVSKPLRDALDRAALALAARGARVQVAHLPRLRKAFDIWSACMAEAAETSFVTLLTGSPTFRMGPAMARWLLLRSPYTLPSLVLAGLEGLTAKMPARHQRNLAEATALRAEIDDLLPPGTVWLHPSYSRTAPRHFRPLLTPFDWVHTGIMNVLGVPVTQVPLGLDHQGLPLGVQVAGRWFEDHVPIAAALALEEAFGGWVPPAR